MMDMQKDPNRGENVKTGSVDLSSVDLLQHHINTDFMSAWLLYMSTATQQKTNIQCNTEFGVCAAHFQRVKTLLRVPTDLYFNLYSQTKLLICS